MCVCVCVHVWVCACVWGVCVCVCWFIICMFMVEWQVRKGEFHMSKISVHRSLSL